MRQIFILAAFIADPDAAKDIREMRAGALRDTFDTSGISPKMTLGGIPVFNSFFQVILINEVP
jgi:hypothetical protein